MKRLISAMTGAACLGLVFITAVSAQQAMPKVVNGGVLNGKAVSLPKPQYPDAARLAGISGIVAVNVIIDEAGTVISAEADPYDQREQRDSEGNKLSPVEVDPSLREAAENAARQARFAPTLLSGQPIQVKGRIVYNFVADKVSTTAGAVVKHVADGGGEKVDGGVLNSKAKALPAPAYPAAAMAVRAEGVVNVQVLIDEAGNVSRAAAISGHPLLRAAAEKAATDAKFEPTYLNGVGVKVSGVLTYNFVLGNKEEKP